MCRILGGSCLHQASSRGKDTLSEWVSERESFFLLLGRSSSCSGRSFRIATIWTSSDADQTKGDRKKPSEKLRTRKWKIASPTENEAPSRFAIQARSNHVETRYLTGVFHHPSNGFSQMVANGDGDMFQTFREHRKGSSFLRRPQWTRSPRSFIDQLSSISFGSSL